MIWYIAIVSLLFILFAVTSLYVVQSFALRRAMHAAAVGRATEVGALAAGLAHEIRNPLHAIGLNLHTLRLTRQRGKTLSDEEMIAIVEQSRDEIDRIEQLMQQLIGFATPAKPRDETLDLPSEVRAVVDFLEQEMLAADIQVNLDLTPQPLAVRIDRGRLRQILLNLMQNARQAMPDGGSLRIAVRSAGRRAEMGVADSGGGVSQVDRGRIFEPFYSTKDTGTGLGLALVKRFVDEVQGDIQLEENDAGGTTFRVTLPIARERNTVRGDA